VVGAPLKAKRGAAYVFVRSGTHWSQKAKLSASDAASGDLFGFSVALYGSTAVVGAPDKKSNRGEAYVFVRSGTHWSQKTTLIPFKKPIGGEFGVSVALYGSTAVVGAPGTSSNTGAAYVFVGSGKHWSQKAKLTASDAASDDQFGYSVALYGSTAVVGARDKNSKGGATEAGAAYVFARV
jgi:hypothetical protein